MNISDFQVNDQGVLEKYLGCEQKVDIPNNITKIGEYAFTKCSQITAVQFNDNIEEIGAKAFFNCSNLQEIILPNSITNIGQGAFALCSNLTKVILPAELKIIESFTFSKCVNLTEINIPNTVTDIDEKAFFECSKLKNINIPSALEVVHKTAFEGCSKNILKEIKEKSKAFINEPVIETPKETVEKKKRIKKQIIKGENDLIVSKDGNEDYTTISEAIKNAKEGAKIYVNSGSYEEYLEIDKDIELIGDDYRKPRVYVQKGTVCNITSNAKLSFFDFFNTDYSIPKIIEKKDSYYYKTKLWDDYDEEYYNDDEFNTDNEDDEDVQINYKDEKNEESKFSIIEIKGNAVLEKCTVKHSNNIGIRVKSKQYNPIIKGCSISECNCAGIKLLGKCTISNCDFKKNSNCNIKIGSGAEDSVIDNCKISQGRDLCVGIIIHDGSNATVSNCRISGNYHGIVLCDSCSNIEKCKIECNEGSGILCRDNAFSNITYCGFSYNSIGIKCIGVSHGDLKSCRIHHNTKYGIMAFNQAHVFFTDGEIFKNCSCGLFLNNCSSAYVEHSNIYQNVKSNLYLTENVYISINDSKIFESSKRGIVFDNCANGTLKNVIIKDDSECGILIKGDAFPEFINCKISGKCGIYSDGDCACKLEKCVIKDCTENSILITGHSSLQMENSKIKGCNSKFIDHSRPIITNCNFIKSSIKVENISNPTLIDCSLEMSTINISHRARGTYKNCKIYGNEYGILIDARYTFEPNPETKKGEVHKGFMNPTVDTCEIYDCKCNLCIIGLNGGTFKNCNIHGGSDVGVYIQDDKIELQNFEIHDNELGVKKDCDMTYTNCNFHDNKKDIASSFSE